MPTLLGPDRSGHIEAALAADTVVLKAEDYSLNDTITVPFCVGGALVGAGAGPYTKQRHPHRGPLTVLRWAPGAHGLSPIIKIQGSNFWLSDLLVYGAVVGIQVMKPRRGIGSGKHGFDNVMIEDCTIGWAIADDPESNNCDVCSWRDITVHKCTTAWKSVGHQAMQHRIAHVSCRQVDTFLDIRGGGCWYVDDIGLMKAQAAGVTPTLLRIEQTRFGERGRAAIGSNNAYYEVRNLKTDHQAGSVTLLNHVNDCPIDVKLLGGKLGHPPVANIRGNGGLTIRDYSYLGADLLRWNDAPGKRTPHFTLADSIVTNIDKPWELLNIRKSSGQCWVSITNCHIHPSGRKLADLVGLIDAGEAEEENDGVEGD